MPYKIEIDLNAFEKLLNDLKRVQEVQVHSAVSKGGNKLLSQLKTNIAQGRDADGKTYPDVNRSTMEMSIKYGSPFEDRRIRGEVSSNRTPFNVTKQTLESIYLKRNGDATEIGYDDERTELIMKGNARAAGNTDKPARDPLGHKLRNPTDLEFDLVADEVENLIERVLNAL